MTQLEKNYFYSIFFRLEIYKRSGNEFQIFFSDLMMKIDPLFNKVTPYHGDGGNDGFNSESQCYYQVYAPLPTTSYNQLYKTTLSKTLTDFEKLRANWKSLRQFIFVLNDRFMGIPTALYPLIDEIKEKHKLEKAECLGSDRMLDIFNELQESQKLSLLDRAPITEVPFEIDPSAMGQLLHELSVSDTLMGTLDIDAPNWHKKIKFNKINEHLAKRIEVNSYQIHRVDSFLQTNPNLSQEIAIAVNNAYNESKNEIPDDIDNSSEMRYFWMIDRLTPLKILSQNSNKIILNLYRSCIEIILSKYFETCDVYESPN